VITKPPPQAEKKAVKKKAQTTDPILYPEIEVRVCALPDRKGRTHDVLRARQGMDLLGWETEAQYTKRMMALNPKWTEDQCKYGDDYLLTDIFGEKVRTLHNLKNRELREPWCYQIAQDILTHNFELNLESIIISLYGNVTSGQHRLIALVIAYQKWLKDKNEALGEMYSELWPEEPFIETLVAFGGSEDPKVMRSIDNVKPRSLSDVIYTGEHFKELKSVEKKECSRMLDVAVDFLWKRTHAQTAYQMFQTHSASVDFIDRHKRLIESVRILFDANAQRSISELRISPGLCTGLHFLMAAAASDIQKYKEDLPPLEKSLDFSMWDKATQFFQDFSGTVVEEGKETRVVFSKDMEVVRTALKDLVNEELNGEKARSSVFIKAWNEFAYNGALTKDNLSIEEYYTRDGVGAITWIDCPKIGGIDQGYRFGKDKGESTDPAAPTPEEIEKLIEEARIRRAEELKLKAEAIRIEKQQKKMTPIEAASQPLPPRNGAKKP